MNSTESANINFFEVIAQERVSRVLTPINSNKNLRKPTPVQIFEQHSDDSNHKGTQTDNELTDLELVDTITKEFEQDLNLAKFICRKSFKSRLSREAYTGYEKSVQKVNRMELESVKRLDNLRTVCEQDLVEIIKQLEIDYKEHYEQLWISEKLQIDKKLQEWKEKRNEKAAELKTITENYQLLLCKCYIASQQLENTPLSVKFEKRLINDIFKEYSVQNEKLAEKIDDLRFQIDLLKLKMHQDLQPRAIQNHQVVDKVVAEPIQEKKVESNLNISPEVDIEDLKIIEYIREQELKLIEMKKLRELKLQKWFSVLIQEDQNHFFEAVAKRRIS